jgi:uncharacterized protein (DUF1330 family)
MAVSWWRAAAVWRRWPVTTNGHWAVIRFPDLAAVHAWHNDPDYQKIVPLRTQGYADLEITVFQE